MRLHEKTEDRTAGEPVIDCRRSSPRLSGIEVPETIHLLIIHPVDAKNRMDTAHRLGVVDIRKKTDVIFR